MKPRERVLHALRRDALPDRVPLQFDLCRSLLEAFGHKLGVPVEYTTSYYEDVTYRISANALRTAMGSDCAVVGGGLPAGYSHLETDADPEHRTVVNEFGMKMRQGPLYMEVIEAPLADISSEDEVRRFPMPDPLAEGRFDGAQADIARFKDDYFIIGDLELTMFEMAWHMTGMEQAMLAMSAGEPYFEVLLDRVKAFSIGVGKRLVELGVDAIWTGDDFGSQHGMLISPTMWRDMFKPRYAELFAELRAANPELLICYHSDGAVAPILDDLVEIGMDVFNPVQPNVPGHDPRALKARLGDRLSFWGAIDQQHLLPHASEAEIARDVAEKVAALGPGGGYMCAPAHIIQADTSMENVEAFIRAVQTHGVYS